MKITDGLVAEHKIFLGVFEHIERLLPRLTTSTQATMMAALVESMLKGHANAETNLAYLALDHALAEKGQLERMYQDHHEIDTQLKNIRKATSCPEACRLLRVTLQASREHFREEERTVFPLLEKLLDHETLVKLGSAWLHGAISEQEGFLLAQK